MGCGCGGRARGRGISVNQRNKTLKPQGVKQKNTRTKSVKGIANSASPVQRAKQRINRLRREAIRRVFGK